MQFSIWYEHKVGRGDEEGFVNNNGNIIFLTQSGDETYFTDQNSNYTIKHE